MIVASPSLDVLAWKVRDLSSHVNGFEVILVFEFTERGVGRGRYVDKAVAKWHARATGAANHPAEDLAQTVLTGGIFWP